MPSVCSAEGGLVMPNLWLDQFLPHRQPIIRGSPPCGSLARRRTSYSSACVQRSPTAWTGGPHGTPRRSAGPCCWPWCISATAPGSLPRRCSARTPRRREVTQPVSRTVLDHQPGNAAGQPTRAGPPCAPVRARPARVVVATGAAWRQAVRVAETRPGWHSRAPVGAGVPVVRLGARR